MADTTEEKVLDLIAHPITLFPDFKGKRIETDKRFGDGVNKATLSCPIPESDEEAIRMYGVDLAGLFRLAIKGHLYGETWFASHIKESVKNGVDLNSDTFIDGLQVGFESAVHRTPRVAGAGGGAKAEAMKYRQLKQSLGVESDEELQEIMADMRARKAKKNKK